MVNISHSSCTCNGDRVGLLIKTKSIQKERMMSQTIIRTFEALGQGESETITNDVCAQMVVILTIKEISYVVVGPFHHLVGPP